MTATLDAALKFLDTLAPQDELTGAPREPTNAEAVMRVLREEATQPPALRNWNVITSCEAWLTASALGETNDA